MAKQNITPYLPSFGERRVCCNWSRVDFLNVKKTSRYNKLKSRVIVV